MVFCIFLKDNCSSPLEKIISPALCPKIPHKIEISVVLPAPLGPRIPYLSLERILRFTPLSVCSELFLYFFFNADILTDILKAQSLILYNSLKAFNSMAPICSNPSATSLKYDISCSLPLKTAAIFTADALNRSPVWVKTSA